MKKHAILLSGGVNFNNNHTRYRNDLEFAYKVLLEDCGFRREDIEIFYTYGIDIKYGKEVILTKAAWKADIIKSIEDKKNYLKADDEFVLIVSNHGVPDNGGGINLWGDDILDFTTLCKLLEQICAMKVLILGECYGGDILKFEIRKACVMTANMQGMISYANPYSPDYDEFLYHFFSYIHGSYPNGDSLKQCGENNIKNAFQYAVDMDVFAPNSLKGELIRNICQENIIQIPQMKCDIEEELSL